MLKRGKRRVGISIDMTPMVDIAFLLLIFYMATTTFKPQERKTVALPASHSEIKVPEHDIMSIIVTQEDSIFVDFVTKKKETIAGEEHTITDRIYEIATLSTLPAVITNFRLKNPRLRIIIKADQEVLYGTMAGIMDALQLLNLNRFHLITQLETEE